MRSPSASAPTSKTSCAIWGYGIGCTRTLGLANPPLQVELIFNERIIIPEDRFNTVQPRTLKFESGKVIETDAQIFTVCRALVRGTSERVETNAVRLPSLAQIGSPKPNSSVFQKGLLSSAVDSVTGQFKVNEFVQVQGVYCTRSLRGWETYRSSSLPSP